MRFDNYIVSIILPQRRPMCLAKAFVKIAGVAISARLRKLRQAPLVLLYQYSLLKYYTEHYRMQKYAPNAGYVQFLFNDMCPQSFYGLYDWWGMPKPGLNAMLESNMPLGIFLKFNGEEACEVYAVNDSYEARQGIVAKCVFTDANGNVIFSREQTLDLQEDTRALVCCPNITRADCETLHCALMLFQNDTLIASNHYEDLFNLPPHVQGHPHRISHELGMRLFNC